MNPFLKRLRWYKDRLAAMSGPEILYRANEAAKRKIDRRYGRRFIAPLRDYGALPSMPALREGLEAWAISDALLAEWAEQAQRVRDGSYFLLNQQWPASPRDTVWHLDPSSKTLWPRDLYCFNVNYRHAQDMGDVKLVWELNRLQHLQVVAALACKKRDAALAAFCLERLESWIDNNPPFLGVNWNSGIEIALRLISMLVVTSLVGEQAERPLRSKIWATFDTHAHWLARYPSRHSSANNHRVAEGLGLFAIGALCPHLRGAARWKKEGWHILRESARLQILPDGAGAEQTVAYTAFVLEMLLTGLKIAQATGMTIPDAYLRKMTLGGEYLRWLTDSGGHQPQIGDDDNACVLAAYRAGDDYVSSITACVAALTGRADITPPNLRPHFRQAFFGLPPVADFPPQGMRCFPHAGLTVGRHRSVNGEILLAFDHGYLGYLSIAAHGHADALSVWLHIDDQPVFVDAGTYLYHAREDERRLFRSTAAHNTMTVENMDSSGMAGNFNWSRQAAAIVRQSSAQGQFWQVEAEHDGYEKVLQTRHRRSLSVSPASGAVIEDKIISPQPRPVSISFLLHPGLTARREDKEIMIMKGEYRLLRMRHESSLDITIGLPGTPDSGWYSPAFAIKQPTTRIIFSGILASEQTATTHLFWAS